MTSIKDKLASSVRQAKTGAEPAGAEKADKAATRKAPPSDSAAATTTATADAAPAPEASLADEPPSSAQELFPGRVWPD
jgi:hypothetical protein